MLTHYPQANGLSNHCCVGHRAWVLKAQRSKSSRPVGSWGPPSWFLASGFIIILASLIMRCMSCLYVLDGRAKMRANITPKAFLPSKTYLYINGHFSFPSLPNFLCSSSCCVEAQLEILISWNVAKCVHEVGRNQKIKSPHFRFKWCFLCSGGLNMMI